MAWDFADYSGEDETPSLPLFLSERSQQILLAAINRMQKSYAWLDGDDPATYDIIQAQIAETITELIVTSMPDFTPVGMVMWYIGVTISIPEKWLRCEGQVLAKADYPDLTDILEPPFDTHPTITLPDLRDKFLYGASVNADLGDVGGTASVALTIPELPAHTHNTLVASGTGANNLRVAMGNNMGLVNAATSSVGSGTAHNNMPPYMRGYWLIKALP